MQHKIPLQCTASFSIRIILNSQSNLLMRKKNLLLSAKRNYSRFHHKVCNFCYVTFKIYHPFTYIFSIFQNFKIIRFCDTKDNKKIKEFRNNLGLSFSVE